MNFRTGILSLVLVLCAASSAHAAPHDDGSGAVRLVLTGPVVVLLLLSGFALIALIAAFLRQAHTLTAFGGKVLACLGERRIVTPVWGIAAALLCLFASFALFSNHTLTLLGILVLASGMALTGLGLGVAAVHLGELWTQALAGSESSSLTTLTLGLLILLLAAAIPIVGWLAVIVAVGGGLGAVLECLFGRR